MFGSVTIRARGLRLGEGPVWDAHTQSLWFVDITQNRIFILDETSGDTRTIQVAGMVGCVVPAGEGMLLAAVRDTLVRIDLASGAQTAHCSLELPAFLRCNDGKCDARGRLWVGTMAVEQQHARARRCGSLYCIAQGAVLAKYDGFTIPNGMAWNADGTIFYHVDTPTRRIDAYDVDAQGLLQNRRTAINLAAEVGTPDGMCIDANGNLWIAMWGGGQILCVNPTSEAILHRLVVQDKNVSCCTFGGADLQTLYITTAQDEDGRGGNVFAVRTQIAGEIPFQYGG